MKLRNLMYATMIACAFASCSKDDENIPTPDGGEEADATLSLQIAPPLSTKAISSVAEGEVDTKITSLTSYVFDVQTGLLEAVGETKVSDVEVEAANLKAGTKKVIVLANIKPTVTVGAAGTTYDQFIAMSSANLANEKNGALSMNSQVFDIVLKAGVKNYLGYDKLPSGDTNGNLVLGTNNQAVSATPVKLYRNVAKVVLNKITLSDKNKSRYPNGVFQVENVYILNGRFTTNIVGAGAKAWGTTMAGTSAYENGMTTAEYAAWVATFEGLGETALFSYLSENYSAAAFADYVGAPKDMTLTYTDTETKAAVDQFYVYENTLAQTNAKATDANTLLVVKGKFKYDGNPNPDSRYYTVSIGHTGTAAITLPENFGMTNDTYEAVSGRANLNGVIRNLQYNVNLTVAGPGYTTPVGPSAEDDTFLDTKVEVVAFGAVQQDVEIE